ncbi:hypothetical protein [Leclercia adecarboxylata]|uniref:Uncharacterized protein n=1 Tax=Leclercia adecarboxylata TaxID=83655 RepID=A0A4U9I4X4_9ENTR|nr:hypothetical protein [Leclercia adecarboxylata]PHH04940.1 hypothetical protein CRX53_13725 [Leclercia adecarboxylata]UBH68456.1 hypothetical protein LA332_04115 [Leclercia adecarboxylata]SPX64163.1 Uncharacterised protein [Leclercia adecarboxylata]STX23159.1 Uncharacterised protein [Leclercia adecarboxylata]VTP70289.1 Uncharacterised protein [Leclercia adecarboxylata]
MAISQAIALAAVTQQMNKVQDAVNSAFKPLISNACEMPERLNVEESLRRCTAIVASSKLIEEMAKEGMQHLANVRSGNIDVSSVPEGFIESLSALVIACKNARGHVVEMFTVAESSPMWSGHISMLRPLKRKYVKALSAVENIAGQMIDEVKQVKSAAADVDSFDIVREDAISMIKTSHIILGADSPKWM